MASHAEQKWLNVNAPAITEEERAEWDKCAQDRAHFITRHVYIKSEIARDWVLFELWPAQVETLREYELHRRLIIMKARQLGMSWLDLADSLWEMVFHPAATILLFSKRDEEAVELLDVRLKGMYERLRPWMKRIIAEDTSRATRPQPSPAKPAVDAKHQWGLPNGSRAMAFPTTGGRSYTGTKATVDEADFVGDLGALLNAVNPTIEAGGRLSLISTVDKSLPQSPFKMIFRAAMEGLNAYKPVFFGWRARPGRDDAWYEEQRRDVLARTGALDDLHQEYPASVSEALAPRTLDKRIPSAWIELCYSGGEVKPIDLLDTILGVRGHAPPMPSIPGLRVYRQPEFGREYVIGADPAEGNPNSDPSSFTVMDKATGEEAAMLAGKYEPAVFGSHLKQVGNYYNRAGVLPERNNHGHAVILWLLEHAKEIPILSGPDGRPGWLTTSNSKTAMYDTAADAFRLRDTILHSYSTYVQLASIEASTLRAPKEEHDDEALGYALALSARALNTQQKGRQYNYIGSGSHAVHEEEEERDPYQRYS